MERREQTVLRIVIISVVEDAGILRSRTVQSQLLEVHLGESENFQWAGEEVVQMITHPGLSPHRSKVRMHHGAPHVSVVCDDRAALMQYVGLLQTDQNVDIFPFEFAQKTKSAEMP